LVGKAISIRQPWAWAIVEGWKDVENRTWPTAYRGPLLIHAGLREDNLGWLALDRMGVEFPEEVEGGGIIGVVDLVDCARDYDSPWAAPGCWHWLLENPRPLPFRATRGRLGIFHVEIADPLAASV
jgi:ASCH domain